MAAQESGDRNMSSDIRIRACVAVVQDHKILLVPQFDTDVGPV